MDLVLTVLIVVAVQLISFLVLRGQIQQELNTTKFLRDVQEEVDGMVRELNLSAERNIGLLEARIEELEGLLAQADQKVVLMARELERRERSAETYSQLRRAALPEGLSATSAESIPAAESAEIPTENSVPQPELVVEWPASPPPAEDSSRPRSLKERVLGFRDQGLDGASIAAATGATRSEVDLILSLNPLPRNE